MKTIVLKLNERDLDILKKDQQVWMEIEGHVYIIRELIREVPQKAIKG
jgi:hypothetical protein